MPDEPFDLYSDSFLVTLTPFGCNLTFNRNEPNPVQNRVPQVTTLGHIRMSIEHLKAMIFMARKQVLIMEENGGITFDIPTNVLNQMGISPEDWDGLWQPLE